MKSHNQRKFNIVFIAFFAISLSHVAFTKYRQSLHLSYWAQSEDSIFSQLNKRSPSSRADFNQDAIDNLKTYFNFSTFKKYVDYKLSLNFRSDVPELQTKEKWRPLFHRSLERTLTPKTSQANNLESIFLTAFNDSLLHDFTKKFLEELSSKNIKKGRFQVDITFKPQLAPQFNYNSEITNNRLINWGQTNQFRRKLDEQRNESKVTLAQHILNTPLPNTSTDYQYKGGIISFWIELTDDNKAAGYVRFRKYFTAPHIQRLKPFIKGNDLRLSMIHYKAATKENHQLYVTSDFYQSFSLENPKPKAERLELHFGKLLPNNLSYKNLGDRSLASLSSQEKTYSKKERPLNVGQLDLHGSTQYEGKSLSFVSTVESLVFNFGEGEFSKKSRIKTNFKDKKLKGHRKGTLKHRVSQALLDKYGLELIQKFRLDNLHPRFKGAKGKTR